MCPLSITITWTEYMKCNKIVVDTKIEFVEWKVPTLFNTEEIKLYNYI